MLPALVVPWISQPVREGKAKEKKKKKKPKHQMVEGDIRRHKYNDTQILGFETQIITGTSN